MSDGPAPAAAGASIDMGCYLYCVAPVFDLSGLSLRGLGGAGVYQVAFGDIAAVVHDCPAVPYEGDNEQAREWLLAHHAVIDAVWEQAGTALPMTFDVIIRGAPGQNARPQVAAWLEENHASFREQLDSMRGKAELAIQVSWDPTALQEIIAGDAEVRRLQSELQGKSRGMAFFYQQKIEKLIRQKADTVVDELSRESLGRIEALAVKTCINKPKRLDGLEMLLNLSVLVDRVNIPAIGEVLGELQERRGIAIHFTGPWPPYSFAMTTRTGDPGE